MFIYHISYSNSHFNDLRCPLLTLGGEGKKSSGKEIFLEMARNASPFFIRSHPELKWKVTFSMLGRVRCVAPPGMARPVCNFNPCWKSWASNEVGCPGPPLKWKRGGPRALSHSSHWAAQWLWGQGPPGMLPPSPWVSWEVEKGAPTGFSVRLPCPGLVNTFLSTIAAEFPHFWINE